MNVKAKKGQCEYECKNKKEQTFSVPAEKEVRKVNNEDNEDVIIISYKIKFNDSARFMQVD